MFCRYCGNEMAETERFCKACGKERIAEMAEAVNMKKRGKKAKRWVIALIAVLVVAVGTGAIIFYRQQTGYKKAVKDFFTAMETSDAQLFLDVTSSMYKNTNQEMSESDILKETQEDLDDWMEEYEEDCGTIDKISYKIYDVESYSYLQLQAINSFNEALGYDEDLVSDAVVVHVQCIMEGRYMTLKCPVDITVLKVDGKWGIGEVHWYEQ